MYQQTQEKTRKTLPLGFQCRGACQAACLNEMILNSINRVNSFFRLAKCVAHHHVHDDQHSDKGFEPSYGHLVQLVN